MGRPPTPRHNAIDHDRVEDWVDRMLIKAPTIDVYVDHLDDMTWSLNGKCLNVVVWAAGKFDNVEDAAEEIEQCFDGVAGSCVVTWNSTMHMFNIAMYCVLPHHFDTDV